MRKPLFDRKFGAEFIKSIPLGPGVYEMINDEGQTIYVGKAKLLRRRLQQYRNAKRRKKHLKMKTLVRETSQIKYTSCNSELEALLLENELIQKLRPRFNIAGAFSFLYPMIGLTQTSKHLTLCYTTTPSSLPMFDFYGAFRSRQLTREAYFSLLELLSYIGHRQPSKQLRNYPKVKFSHIAEFRQVSEHWVNQLEVFLKGESNLFLESLVTHLLEKASARRRAEELQECLEHLIRFYRFETHRLRKAMISAGITGNGVSQEKRDQIFLKARLRKKGKHQELR